MKTLLFLLISGFAFGQNPYEATIRQQATEMAMALPKKDYTTLARYTHPNVVKAMGGSAKMIGQVKQQVAIMEQQGVRFTNVTIGKPSAVVAAGPELQCVVPQTITIQTPQQQLRQASSLIAFSSDGGKQWVFVDTQPSIDKIRKVIPSISRTLVVPARQAPQVIN